MSYVDEYCERTAQGLWHEPLNAVSNLAFLLASALLLWLLAGQRRRVPASVWLGGERAALGGYLPALIGLLIFGVAVRFTAPADAIRFGNWLLLAAVVFAVSLTLRTLDEPLCDRIPIGTHYLWHCLNATVLFIVSYAVLRRWQSSRPPA